MEKMAKAGFVTIIGKPNVGKSTLMNTLIGQKIAITSYKPQTTRRDIRTVYTEERGQIVFLDTPGMRVMKDRLGRYMLKAARSKLAEADCILWLMEPRVRRTANGQEAADPLAKLDEEDRAILKELAGVKAPVILVITKRDTVKKAEVLPVINACADAWRKMTGEELPDIIPVSSRTGEGIGDLKASLFEKLPEGEPFYGEDTVTTETERDIAAEIIREKILRLLQEEVPHGIAVVIRKMHFRKRKPPKTAGALSAAEQKGKAKIRQDEICDLEADIICEREAHKGIIIGAGGQMLRKIGTAARVDIENMTGCRVNLQLFVKVRRDWKDDAGALKQFGYDEKKL